MRSIDTTGVKCRALTTFAFFSAAGVCTFLFVDMKVHRKISQSKLSVIFFLIEAAIILVALIVGTLLNQSIDNALNVDHWSVVVLGYILAASMGWHCASAKESFSNMPATTVMTNTLVTVC
jgi:hypothetical protein